MRPGDVAAGGGSQPARDAQGRHQSREGGRRPHPPLPPPEAPQRLPPLLVLRGRQASRHSCACQEGRRRHLRAAEPDGRYERRRRGGISARRGQGAAPGVWHVRPVEHVRAEQRMDRGILREAPAMGRRVGGVREWGRDGRDASTAVRPHVGFGFAGYEPPVQAADVDRGPERVPQGDRRHPPAILRDAKAGGAQGKAGAGAPGGSRRRRPAGFHAQRANEVRAPRHRPQSRRRVQTVRRGR
mmetsp:Transcript_11579/g.46636  ORF Transcript_11579/g.46636 Transcript_11579/m.46636 type:complete len:242 (+) Transcript_11579:303-1028(+)